MTVTAQRIITTAEAYIGMSEDLGSNRGRRLDTIQRAVSSRLGWGDWLVGQPWCGTFLYWCYWRAGVADRDNPADPSTETMWQRALTNGTLTTTPVVGCPIVWRGIHTGLVVAVGTNTVATIEGNSGDAVTRRTRPLTGDHRFIVPEWLRSNQSPPSTAHWLEDLQAKPVVWGPWRTLPQAQRVLRGLPPARRRVSTIVQPGQGGYAIREGTPRKYGPWATAAARAKAQRALETRLGHRLRAYNTTRKATTRTVTGVAETLGKTT